jgi:uncharacterized protein with NAD-binding domain and iron-sulfur cluster
VTYLHGRGVDVRLGMPVEGISVSGGRVAGVVAGGHEVTADMYVAALPVEVMRTLASPALRAAEPRLDGLDRLVTRWMNGVLFYLDRDVPLVNGHAIYVDSEWALTSISQKQFWAHVDLSERGDGRTRGILSIDVSEWQRPGRRTGKVGQRCSRDEIFEEVWGQVLDHLDGGELDGVQVVDRFLDPAIVFPNPTEAGNLEPLLVNTAGSWADRPDAVTAIPNLFLASDYVRTYTDLATMEAANEAARRAVNGLLEAVGSTARRCPVWALQEPGVFAPARALDRLRWKVFRRSPARPPFEVRPDGTVAVRGAVGRGLLLASRLRRR